MIEDVGSVNDKVQVDLTGILLLRFPITVALADSYTLSPLVCEFGGGRRKAGYGDSMIVACEGAAKPLGAKKANLDPYTRDVIKQFAWQESIHEYCAGISKAIAGFEHKIICKNHGCRFLGNDCLRLLILMPLHFTILSHPKCHPLCWRTGYVGAQPQNSRPLLPRGLHPYGITVAEITNRISNLRNKLGKEGIKDEGLVVFPKVWVLRGTLEAMSLLEMSPPLEYARTSGGNT
ncbi:hypothetical protein NC652_019966 [Populus alba x Populus x berolinensis]|nr:hypothetical protein NC652_019966 [Populus alba x Populus x berolinensis]